MIKAFELSTDTVAFLFQVFDYRCEIGHREILAGNSGRSPPFHQRVVGYFALGMGPGRFLIFLSAASCASAARLSLSYWDMLLG